MNIRHKRRIIEINNLKRVSWIGMTKGLMFTRINTRNRIFVFNKLKKRSIHSFFVFYDFLAIWLDKDNNVIEHRVVKPFSFSIKPSRPFSRLIEIPLNKNNRKAFGFLVAEQKGL